MSRQLRVRKAHTRMALAERRRGVSRAKSWGWDDIEVLLRRDKLTSSPGEDVFRGDAWFLSSINGHVFDGWLSVRERYYGYGYQRWEWSEVSSWDPDEDRAYHIPAHAQLMEDMTLRLGRTPRWRSVPSEDPIEASRGFSSAILSQEDETFDFNRNELDDVHYVIYKDRMPLESDKWWWYSGPSEQTLYRGAWGSNSYALPFAWEDPGFGPWSLAIAGPENYDGDLRREWHDNSDEDIPF